MRVLQVIDSLGAGGAERSLADMVPRLADLGVELTIVPLAHAAEGVEDELRGLDVTVHPLGVAGRRAQVSRLRALLADARPDVVHTTLFEADVVGRLAAGRRRPVLTSIVNTSYDRARLDDPRIRRSRLRLAQALDAVTAHLFTDHFHAIGDAAKRSAVAHLRLRPDQITVVPRGRDRARMGAPSPERRRRVRRSLGIADDAPVIVNIGRQEFQKAQLDLLAAVVRLEAGGLRCVVLQAGRVGAATPELEAFTAAHDLASVRFLGFRGDVPDLLCAADVFAFPSRFEGLGGAALEAMALEVPIVASDIPPLVELLDGGRCGVLTAPGDPVGLADALGGVLRGDDRAARDERVAAARRRFEAVYDLDAVCVQMAELYRRVAALSRRR